MGQGPQAWLLGRLDALLSEKQRRSSPEDLGRYRVVVGAVLFLLVLDAVLVLTAPLFPHGFGLHASALAAEELDGRLRCTSDGPGQGATFIIELPLRGQEARA